MSDNKMLIKSLRYDYSVDFSTPFGKFIKNNLKTGDVFLVDKNVYSLFESIIKPVVDGNHVILIESAEQAKEYNSIGNFLEKLIDVGLNKKNKLFAIGGGITQDITSFISSIYFRGIDWVFVPTNLLSQCDSCIGSKTSINFGSNKNQLGGFYPPKEICIDIEFIKTLPKREILSGLGEMAHYYLIDGIDSYTEFEQKFEQANTNHFILKELIYKSLVIKKKMVEIDEFDQGPRRVFNYGHSFGHALETLSGYQLPHGIAVSYGMALANLISVELGLLDKETQLRIQTTLEKIWVGSFLPKISFPELLSALSKDKKNKGNQIRVILTKGIGDMFLTPLPITVEVETTIMQFLTQYTSDI